MGSSGAGKTTLLSLLAGLDRPTHGPAAMPGHPHPWP
ncbi:MAG: ATP-binding cassette domain-containing protein [Gammaproteobacteria bacterium]|nr:ATP-binding cassette domain-containing protein [Gammaproteobacteria bacterium]